MPQVIYYVAASLDGYIATPDGGIAWLSSFEGTGEDYGYARFYASVDAVLMGRRTYEQSLAFGEWPYPGKPCWVFSHRKLDIADPSVVSTDRNPHELVNELKARNLHRVWLVGGGELARSFQNAAHISEYIVSVIPVILGSGVSLFASGGTIRTLKLVESTQYSSGIVQLRYLQDTDA